ncbi:hypothetical protein GCM10025865_23920 [Paraoerskovia sediminicola]|uniref:Uncharacterized protein n=1 Tax=Paraoerskovia sediminicola TaxID=1138587 RepID=A0ABM8G4T7_9CELL|nr:hypothetical protein GCM10025865_23920 [Paraoerskovia sediminicola]
MARSTPAAVTHETGCSVERPPNRTRTRGLRPFAGWLDIVPNPTGALPADGSPTLPDDVRHLRGAVA